MTGGYEQHTIRAIRLLQICSIRLRPGDNLGGRMAETTLERETLRCKACGLVQFRTRNNLCRRCLVHLPEPVLPEMISPPVPPPLPEATQEMLRRFLNRDTVANIGRMIRRLRERRGLTQSNLQARSGVSRSYLSRIESGQMTPSLATLEKVTAALQVTMAQLFTPVNGSMLDDYFIAELRPYLRRLDGMQWSTVLRKMQELAALGPN